jgi:hypothetical protein
LLEKKLNLRYNKPMNKLRLTALLLLLCFLLFFHDSSLAAQETGNITGDRFEETTGRGLLIRTNPPGVHVFIDGVERGLTPVSFENLPQGEYNIRLRREGFRERRFNVIVFNNSRLVISIEMEEERGIALVSVHRAEGSPDNLPFNPQIFTTALGETYHLNDAHTTVLNLPAGLRTIRARAFGWEDTSQTVLISEFITAVADIYMKPATFRLNNFSQSRRRFNPKNSGSLGMTEYRFEVSAPGTGTLVIQNINGETVYERQLYQFDTWLQSVTWEGRDSQGYPLPEGIYTAVIETLPLLQFSQGSIETTTVTLTTEINYSINIFPLSLSGGISGLVFAPVPYTLPAGSLQLEGGIQAGSFSSLPFEIGFRIAPVNRLEILTLVNATPRFNESAKTESGNSAGWGIAGSLKFNIFNNNLFAFAAGISCAWADANGESPIGAGRGTGLYAPVSIKLPSPALEKVSFVLSPGVFWRDFVLPVPVLLLSAGALYRGEWLIAGISCRPEIDLRETSKENIRLFAGAELRFFPPPSFLVFSLHGGVMMINSRTDGYGGVGIGIIY